jgi:hypothetical protein
MASSTARSPLHGKTVRWTFDNGPVAGKTFEHRFEADGSLTWRGTGAQAKDHAESSSAAVQVSDDVQLVSYLSRESAYTLTVALNLKTGKAIGFASNGKDWVRQSGTFEVLDA